MVAQIALVAYLCVAHRLLRTVVDAHNAGMHVCPWSTVACPLVIVGENKERAEAFPVILPLKANRGGNISALAFSAAASPIHLHLGTTPCQNSAPFTQPAGTATAAGTTPEQQSDQPRTTVGRICHATTRLNFGTCRSLQVVYLRRVYRPELHNGCAVGSASRAEHFPQCA